MDCLPAAFSSGRLLRLLGLLLLGSMLAIAGPGMAQEKSSGKGAGEPAETSKEEPGEDAPGKEGGEESADPGSGEPPPPELTAEEIRELMLERLADNLSVRARSLQKREKGLSEREGQLFEREKAIAEREKAIAELEKLLESREKIIRRRENLPPPQAWKGPKAPSIVAKHAAVIDGRTMQFYHTKSADYKIPVASTQKLLTALLVCEAGDLDEEIEVPKEVYDVEPTVVGIKPGEKYTRRQILTGLLVRSGNDLAATLAIDNAGSVPAFAEKMNLYARALGMENSNFKNPHGLPAEGQYSTAHDMALAAFEAFQVPEIREIVKLRRFDFVFNSGKVYELYNTNKVLTSLESCNGMKTGFTYASGHCLVSSASENGQDRIAVVLKSYKPYVWSDSQKLLEWSLGLEMEGPVEETSVAIR